MVTLPRFYTHHGIFVRLLTLAFLLLFVAGARAATITVTRGDDRNATCDPGVDCSLREAVALANSQAGDDTILFNISIPATITLTGGEIAITSNVTIKGPGVPNYAFADDLVISGNGATRIFAISGATTVTIGGLTLTGGTGIGSNPSVQGGGAIRAGGSLLTLDTVRVVNNPAGSTVGGGVYVPTGALTVINSTFSGNTARAGGAIYHDGTTLKIQGSTFNGNQATAADDSGGGGAVYSDDPTVISNSTFSGNSTAFYGGGVYFIGTSIETLTVRNSTFTGNSAGDFAGGIGNFGDGGGTVANTIISLNTAGSLPNYYDGGSINEVNNYTGNSPGLGALADNGGPTQTHALQAGSPAINAGSNSQALDVNGATLTTDQRGPGSARITSGTVDIGAFEFGSAPAPLLTVTKTADSDDGTCDSDCSLREAVTVANGLAGSATVFFHPNLSGQTITLGGDVGITDGVTITGLGQDRLTVSGGGVGRIFTISGAVSVAISDLTLTGGSATGGGAILGGPAGSLLTLNTVRVVNNTAGDSPGGGVFTPAGALTVINSTFDGNTAKTGGGIYHDGTTLKVQGSTFSNNHATSNADPDGGGGIFSDDPTTISNSTFSGNTSNYAGGGLFYLGTSSEPLVIRSSTFTANTATQFAGGIFNSEANGTLANTIVSLNTAGSLPNLYDGGSLTKTNNYTGNSPGLGALQDNGGPTRTHGLLAGSPAVNAGSNSQALDVNGATLTTDQRGSGFPRILSGVVDIGAFEGVVVGNNPPSITPAGPLSRQQGSPGGAAVQIATVSDAETDDGSLNVTVVPGGTATGVSVTSITNSGGNVTAVVQASCTATSGTVRLQVSDGTNNVTGDLTVNVTQNDAPTLSYPDPQYVTAGGSLTVFPASGPSDNGGVASVALQDVSPNTFSGTISVNGSDGSVTVTNAGPAGDYVVTVRATDNCGETTDATFTLRVTSAPSAGQVLISEFRFNGPAGDGDEFYELYNNTNADLTVVASDDSGGWSLAVHDQAADGINIVGVIPNGTVIPARGHYLITNTGVDCPCYSLDAYATGDTGSSNTVPAAAGIALFTTANPANFGAATRLDAAATGSESDPLFKEGTALPAVNSTAEYSFVRRMGTATGGLPQDTGDNSVDFALVAADTSVLPGAIVGAPGPENLASPLQRNSQFTATLLDPAVSSTTPPNRVRSFTSDPANNSTFGTLSIRRTFTNHTGEDVTRLRFRIIDITTYPTAVGVADLRARTSAGGTYGITGPNAACPSNTCAVAGLTLDPPSGASNGGLNSSLTAGTITLDEPLADGASINVEFLLGVQQAGLFRFYVNVEVLTGAPASDAGVGEVEVMKPSTGARKGPVARPSSPGANPVTKAGGEATHAGGEQRPLPKPARSAELRLPIFQP